MGDGIFRPPSGGVWLFSRSLCEQLAKDKLKFPLLELASWNHGIIYVGKDL